MSSSTSSSSSSNSNNTSSKHVVEEQKKGESNAKYLQRLAKAKDPRARILVARLAALGHDIELDRNGQPHMFCKDLEEWSLELLWWLFDEEAGSDSGRREDDGKWAREINGLDQKALKALMEPTGEVPGATIASESFRQLCNDVYEEAMKFMKNNQHPCHPFTNPKFCTICTKDKNYTDLVWGLFEELTAFKEGKDSALPSDLPLRNELVVMLRMALKEDPYLLIKLLHTSPVGRFPEPMQAAQTQGCLLPGGDMEQEPLLPERVEMIARLFAVMTYIPKSGEQFSNFLDNASAETKQNVAKMNTWFKRHDILTICVEIEQLEFWDRSDENKPCRICSHCGQLIPIKGGMEFDAASMRARPLCTKCAVPMRHKNSDCVCRQYAQEIWHEQREHEGDPSGCTACRDDSVTARDDDVVEVGQEPTHSYFTAPLRGGSFSYDERFCLVRGCVGCPLSQIPRPCWADKADPMKHCGHEGPFPETNANDDETSYHPECRPESDEEEEEKKEEAKDGKEVATTPTSLVSPPPVARKKDKSGMVIRTRLSASSVSSSSSSSSAAVSASASSGSVSSSSSSSLAAVSETPPTAWQLRLRALDASLANICKMTFPSVGTYKSDYARLQSIRLPLSEGVEIAKTLVDQIAAHIAVVGTEMMMRPAPGALKRKQPAT